MDAITGAAPRWTWVSPAAVIATVALVGRLGRVHIYSADFGRYNETYGALGAVVVMMLWLYLSAYVAVAGAALNAELKRQTARETTAGRPRSLGRRDPGRPTRSGSLRAAERRRAPGRGPFGDTGTRRTRGTGALA
jgi:membrane protein